MQEVEQSLQQLGLRGRRRPRRFDLVSRTVVQKQHSPGPEVRRSTGDLLIDGLVAPVVRRGRPEDGVHACDSAGRDDLRALLPVGRPTPPHRTPHDILDVPLAASQGKEDLDGPKAAQVDVTVAVQADLVAFSHHAPRKLGMCAYLLCHEEEGRSDVP